MISISVIGSAGRKSVDSLSDRDLLVIGEAGAVSHAVRPYTRMGWNVSRFSREEFEEMAASQSLFVQHAKQDGRLVRDDGGYLRDTLGGFQITRAYDREVREAVAPIFSIGAAERSMWGRLFQADVLYVALRNACILHRASVASPDFDFSRLVRWAAGAADLSAEDTEHLLRLRRLKVAYRRRESLVDTSTVGDSIEAATKLAWHLESAAGSITSGGEVSNGYFELRDLERRLVTSVGPQFMDGLGAGDDLAELWSVICNPGAYTRHRLECLPEWSRSVSKFLVEWERQYA